MRLIIPVLLFLFVSCKRQDIAKLPAFSENDFVNAVIEIPAGTNRKMVFDKVRNSFKQEIVSGTKRRIDFLPYPANYGFIPSTLMDTLKGGDGDALDILVIGTHIPTANFIEVKPIAVLLLKDRGEDDHKIISVPIDHKFQTIKAHTLENLITDYPSILDIIELWFLNYKGDNEMEVLGWGDEKQALEMIQKCEVKN